MEQHGDRPTNTPRIASFERPLWVTIRLWLPVWPYSDHAGRLAQLTSEPSALRRLPFPEQIVAIDEALRQGRGPDLVTELASFRDHEPLARMLANLAVSGELVGSADSIASVVTALPDTGLRRVLRALEGAPAVIEFAEALVRCAAELPATRITAFAVIDRWLKNVAPSARSSMVDGALNICREALGTGALDRIGDRELMRIPGANTVELAAIAANADVSEAWNARLASFAAELLDTLEAQPKSLSQANAEQLLSRQIYTDPGHFLIELLQNADDAGARVWHLRLEEDRVEVEHDGAPFDARDVVGLLSIGQTTKSKDQIGFFGVGFKSVYEICERPQVYSGAYAFEIADVSIPRPLKARSGLAPDRTLLILPLRDPTDETRSGERLFGRMADLPAEVLLTLNSLREIHVRYGSRRRSVVRHGADDQYVTLRDNNAARSYFLGSRECRYEGPRDASRTTATPVLVAIALAGDGTPEPLGDRPTVYSYLPTNERSGLRMLLHAHFDLPVDRERLDLSSPWNRWAIDQAGELFAELISTLTNQEQQGSSSLLDLLSLPSELGDPAYESIAAKVAPVAFLPAAGGGWLAPLEALLCADTGVVRALAGLVIADERRLVDVLSARHQQVAKELGARDLAWSSVVALLAREAEAQVSGAAFSAPWREHLPELAVALGATDIDLAPLRLLPCLPDHAGRARSPTELLRGSGVLASALRPLCPMLAPELDTSECRPFVRRLGVPRATVADLISRLADPKAALAAVEAAGLDPIMELVLAAPLGQRSGIDQAVLVPTDRADWARVGLAFLTGEGALADLVRDAETRPPLVSREIEDRWGPGLSDLGTPLLDLRAALALLERGELAFAHEQVALLHGAIDEQASEISAALFERVAAADIFPTATAKLCPLRGEGLLRLPPIKKSSRCGPSVRGSAATLPNYHTSQNLVSRSSMPTQWQTPFWVARKTFASKMPPLLISQRTARRSVPQPSRHWRLRRSGGARMAVVIRSISFAIPVQSPP